MTKTVSKTQSNMAKINDNPNEATTLSQAKAILAYMREGNTITPLEALNKFGTLRLSAVIMQIEKKLGYPPPRKFVEVTGRDAEGRPKAKRVMSYWLPKES